MPKRTQSYEEWLIDSLKDPEEAAAYLNAHLAKDEDADDDDELFLMALRHVAAAHGMAQLADKAELGRESLYKALSSEGNPKFSTLTAVLRAIGLQLLVGVRRSRFAH